MEIYTQEIFQNEALFETHFQAFSSLKLSTPNTNCLHDFREEKTLDEDGLEQVCRLCGQVMKGEAVTGIDKLSGCMTLEEFMNVRYGPATAQGLSSFMLPIPTDKRLKVSDKYIDNGILATLRVYTNLARIGEQCNIPKFFVDEAMRSLLRTKKGLYSDHQQVNALRRVIYTAMFSRKNLSHLITALAYYEDAAIEPRKETQVNSERLSRSCLVARCF